MKKLLILNFLFSLSTQAFSQKNVLLVGNGYIEYHNSPEMLERLLKLNNDNINMYSITFGGMDLQKLLPMYVLKAKVANMRVDSASLPNRDKWDYIILQEAPINLLVDSSLNVTIEIIKFFEKELKSNGELFIMENYAFSSYYPQKHCKHFINSEKISYENDIEEYMLELCTDLLKSKTDEEQMIRASISKIQATTQASVISTIATSHFLENRFGKEMTYVDSCHPSPLFSYFLACSFYTAITSKKEIVFSEGRKSQYTAFYNAM